MLALTESFKTYRGVCAYSGERAPGMGQEDDCDRSAARAETTVR
jgi:hypothetical protein